jgi:hypothetical protein
MFEYKNRKFDFKVPDPFSGCVIYDAIISYNIPFGAGALFGLSPKIPMSTEKLIEFQKLCLQNCNEDLGVAKPAVVDVRGYVAITDADAPLLVALTVQFISFFTHWWHDATPSISAQETQNTAS